VNPNLKNLGSTFRQIISWPSRSIIIPMARFIHLGVTLNAQDDGFWIGVGCLLMSNLGICLLKFCLDHGC